MARKAKRKSKPKLTDAERHERFKDMAREVGAEGEAPAFDRTIERLAKLPRETDTKTRED
jgi:hypothetical protein